MCLQHRRPQFNSWVGKIPWRRDSLPISIFLSGEFHGQRSLAVYSPCGPKESDTTKQLSTYTHTHTHTHTHTATTTVIQFQNSFTRGEERYTKNVWTFSQRNAKMIGVTRQWKTEHIWTKVRA